MRLLLFGLAILGLATVVPPFDTLESPQRAKTNATPRPSPVGEEGVRREARPQVRIDTRARQSAPGVSAVHALASASATPVGEAVVRRSDTALQHGAGVHTRESAPGIRTVQGLAPVPVKISSAPATSPSLPQTATAPEAFAVLFESGEFEGTMGPVARLYLAYFVRLPDFEGFQYYIDESDGGRPLAAIADEFAGSREFLDRYGSVDNAAFLDRMAQNVFEGGIDSAQRAQWLEQLESGAITRGQVVLALSESNGFRAATDNDVFVAIAYAETLQRAPEVADRVRWVTFLDAGHPRSALIQELLRTRNSR